MLQTGITGRKEITVTEANTAKTLGSGTLDVFGTPAMIALMELTARTSIEEHLEPGTGSVGTLIEITHDAPTPLGMTVWCESTLLEVDGRKLTFSLEVFDSSGKIGGGKHQRFIIDNEKFQAKANRKIQ